MLFKSLESNSIKKYLKKKNYVRPKELTTSAGLREQGRGF